MSEPFEQVLRAHLTEVIAKHSIDIVAGVPIDAYKERCAYVRAMNDVLAAIPDIIRKARK